MSERGEARSSRQRSESSARQSALAELAALRKAGSSKGGGASRLKRFTVKVEDKVYDTVSEKDYAALVVKRQKESGEFIAGGDDLGYAERGEDDWSNEERSSSGEEGEPGLVTDGRRQKRPRLPGATKQKERSNGSKAALPTPTTLHGNKKVFSMFTGRSAKGGNQLASDRRPAASDDVLDSVLALLGPREEEERERRRGRGAGQLHTSASPHVAAAEVGNRKQAILSEGKGCRPAEERVLRQDLKRETKASVMEQNSAGRQAVGEPANGPTNVPRSSPDSEACQGPTSVALATPADGVLAPPEVKAEVNPLPVEEPDGTGGCLPEQIDARGVCPVEEAKEVGPPKSGLSAKVKAEPAEENATAGWRAVNIPSTKTEVSSPTTDAAHGGTDDAAPSVPADGRPLRLDADGTLPFYFLDAYEEAFGAMPGTVYLFGKVPIDATHVSCCAVVRNLRRSIYAVPQPDTFQDSDVAELEEAAKAGGSPAKLALMKKLQTLAAGMKAELAQRLHDSGIQSFTLAPVKRSYAFERDDIPPGESYFIKITYPYKDPPLPSDMRGKSYTALLGTNTSALESLLVKCGIMGPSWLALSNCQLSSASSQVSHCKLEVAVLSPKDVVFHKTGGKRDTVPPVTVASLNLKTVINYQRNVHEVAAISVIYSKSVRVDGPTPMGEWNTRERLQHFSAVRRLDGTALPVGLDLEIARVNNRAGAAVVFKKSSERELLSFALAKMKAIDADVVVGHNILGFDLDVLLHRLQACKVGSWSSIGRLKRATWPRLTGGSSSFGGPSASPGALACVAGRLLCDTYLSSRELLKEVSYTLTQLAQSQLGCTRRELSPADIPAMYLSSTSLLKLVELAETDAWLALGLMFKLSVLPLSRQLTNLSGNLWSRTLQGARAQRIEYLLLHEFHRRKFILPDKLSAKEKDRANAAQAQKRTKRSTAPPAAAAAQDREEDEDLGGAQGGDDFLEGSLAEPHAAPAGGRKKGPAYAGGLVLEPKKGLYDKYVLLLDFNSLYPSIIQEFNICFTTIARRRPVGDATALVPLPDSSAPSVLPQVIKELVTRRRLVKDMLKKERDPAVKQQLDIRQQALKLTANSMYGCLGFTNSRFYAKPLAELITCQGRDILQSTVDLVQNTLNLEVIYGDTDSIMIHTGLDDIAAVHQVGQRVKKEVNKRYKLLEIEMDGIFRRMLLLKKKKYAAVKVEANPDGSFREVTEQKGLDIVRRDWSILAKDVGNFCLDQILSGSPKEEVVEAIHNHLRELAEKARRGDVELDSYVINRALTKAPEDYPDARNQPHVQVALRRKRSGHREGTLAGDTVPYIICVEKDAAGPSSASFAERAQHMEELKAGDGAWDVDVEYYLSQQVHPVVSRLCAPIEGTDAARIADCLGLDASRFHRQVAGAAGAKEEALFEVASSFDDEDRFRHCEPLQLSCPLCSTSFTFPGVGAFLAAPSAPPATGSATPAPPGPEASGSGSVSRSGSATPAGGPGTPEQRPAAWPLPGESPLRCPQCPDGGQGRPPVVSAAMLANQVKQSAERFITRYYDGWMTCDDEMCGHTTRKVSLRVVPDVPCGALCPNHPRCSGKMIRQYTEAELYTQLSSFLRLLDVESALNKMDDASARAAAERAVSSSRIALGGAAQVVQLICERSAYRWVQMQELCIALP